MRQLGGEAIIIGTADSQLGRGETVADTARVLSRYVDAIMIRTNYAEKLDEMARHASVPVINGLTDFSHPMQAMTDYFTAWEHLGDLKGRKLAYIGDGNNMAHSLMFGASKVGMHIAVATPPSYAPDPEVIAKSQGDADFAGTKVIITNSIEEAVRDADVVETDVWASMGQEAEAQKRQRDFEKWQVSSRVMSLAKPSAIFMHCLPAHRGEEVAAEVIDSPQSVIYDEAENRLHVQKAIMVALMKERAR